MHRVATRRSCPEDQATRLTRCSPAEIHMNLITIIACHNRRELTVRAVQQTQTAAAVAGVTPRFVVFDDGSSDGTAEALRALEADVTILTGDGSAYWASGMAQAERAALGSKTTEPEDFILWLNDDVQLHENAVVGLLAQVPNGDAVVVGAMRDPEDGTITYSGLERAGRHPLNYRRVTPGEKPVRVETFNGNCVLVPVSIAHRLGGIDGKFSHALADIDYGLRCNKIGIPVLLAPRTAGTCARNNEQTYSTAKAAWAAFTGSKGGGNFSSLRRVLRRTNPKTWWTVMIATYSLWWLRRIFRFAS
ncbi:hypothetical protein DEJ24_04980 [Curtobacterium sp. MCPF17_001]|uniref:glycosyltransferase family 2 protein n=1 Tax=Curtobacterium sp. MCPF17_001 TaxID=2175651 RepID=UPI000DA742CB|nr:glycosyltransferase [Curtobacterium sp. MCPF17_001]PZE61612.1 hypothetical protein DEJ24_04980 [Curtobacterium sp. MCPF17_001]